MSEMVMLGEDQQQGMGQEGTNGYGSGSGGTGGCDENSIETQNGLPASGGSAAGSAGSGSECEKARSGSNNQSQQRSRQPSGCASEDEKTQSESNTKNRETVSGETVDEGDKNSSQKNSTTEQGGAPGTDSAETEEKNSEPNQSSVGPDDNTDEQLKSTAGIHTPASNRAPGKSFANLQRYKKCPKCGQVYGNKMGGKSGGSQCIRMLPVYDKKGDPICGADGQELMQRCPYVFVSVKQSKLLKKETKEIKPVLTSSILGDVNRIQKVRQIKQIFYGLMVGKLEKDLQREFLHGDFYVAAVVPTSSMDSENTEFQRVAQPDSGTVADGEISAVLLRHYTGGMADLIDNQMTEGSLDVQLRAAATEMAFERFRESQALGSGSGSGSGGDTAMSDANEDELMGFMRTINLPQHYHTIQKVTVDFASLLEKCVGDASRSLTPHDLVKANIPMGAACKIVMRAREAAKIRSC